MKYLKFVVFDLAWLLITAVIVVLVLFPIEAVLGEEYPFYVSNSIFIFVLSYAIRLIFFIEYSIIRRSIWVKLILVFLMPIVVIPLVDMLFLFQEFVDNKGLEGLFQRLSISKQQSMSSYIRSEMIFFGMSSIIASFGLSFRMINSIWRQKNSNKL